MPFTPFHFGPAAAVKAIIPRQFSFTVFCFAQVVADIEVLFYMARGDASIHRWAHTYAGAVVVAIISVIFGKRACETSLKRWHGRPDVPLKVYFNPAPRITWAAATIGALIGAFSHVLFDSIIHPDVRPFLPFSNVNPTYGLVGEGALYSVCFISAAIGTWLCATIARDKL